MCPEPTPRHVPRRTLLLGGGLAAGAIAAGVAMGSWDRGVVLPFTDRAADDAALRVLMQQEVDLIAAYGAALRSAPAALRPPMRRMAGDHEAHLAALSQRVDAAAPAPTGAAGTGAGAPGFARWEAAAARRWRAACRIGRDPDLAEMFALAYAGELSHALWWEAR